MSLLKVKLERPDVAMPKIVPPKHRVTMDNMIAPPKSSQSSESAPPSEIKKVAQKAAPMKLAKISKKRRPSIEIAQEFVELNLKTVIDVEKEAKLTKKQRKERAQQEKIARKYRYRGLKIFATIVFLLFTMVGIAAFWWQTSIQAVNPNDESSRRFEIAKGATTDQVADALHRAGFIRSALAYKIYTRWTGNLIQAGTHTLSLSMTLPEISNKLTLASVEEVEIQIPPGLTLKQLRDTFKRNGFSDAEIDAAYNAEYDNAILAGRPAGATLEGYIFPDTYRINAGDSLRVLIGKAIDEFEQVVVENDLEMQFAARGLSLHQGVILSSIVQLEVMNSDEQKMVAGVFYNRLDRQMPLQSDPTYRYAQANGLCADDTRGSNCDSIYNTYKHPGLPPSPIANVNARALIATANPTENDYLYFVAGDDGITRFSKTYDEHNFNVATYCKELCRSY